ncbi:hypothetical protein M911_08015 [Ectothiorhodospira haloalkaliphila]|uniref:DsrE/DsrF-like family protein n=1 Tax=Ectothiorhodospira haloalkaliphila TaxID=421628 RepID=W8KH77_9GAMM|nr:MULTISPECIES: hypothetical protein [Ectothiorhodospira]AHK79109.1 hypothetical protein M911_08015 [Ectothiorhodospira haloalkaliphila]MCG5494195.1 hypothetical protein [Ectothiorhodospira variabilis]MCG5497426.1 hypothetical protein [Ectothiorhodospira variabilis]MCG5503275.1 hypothetical protein [Ectothiorhodospira variabilis]MCG5506637.1 hypothetical protein [Ectothiorhodospira variabilis]
MKHLKTGIISLALLLAMIPLAAAADSNRVVVTVTTDQPQTQAMAMILSGQLVERGAELHVLLCDKGGELATRSYEGPTMKGADATPQQIMQNVMRGAASVQVCALFLPNSDYTKDDLIDGVGVATPPQMGELMFDDARFMTF